MIHITLNTHKETRFRKISGSICTSNWKNLTAKSILSISRIWNPGLPRVSGRTLTTKVDRNTFGRRVETALSMNQSRWSGVDFTNILQKAFTEESRSTKRHWWLDYLFALLGSSNVKAARKMLVKFTPVVTNINRFVSSYHCLAIQIF